MTLRAFELRDPSLLIRDIADRVPLVEEVAYVVLIEDPSTTQRIVHVHRLRTPSVIQDDEDACSELRDVMDSLPIPCTPGTWRHLVLTVVIRPGLCVVGPNEGRWLMAWSYSNHAAQAFTGDLILVTEHGWRDWSTELAGTTPALTDAAA